MDTQDNTTDYTSQERKIGMVNSYFLRGEDKPIERLIRRKEKNSKYTYWLIVAGEEYKIGSAKDFQSMERWSEILIDIWGRELPRSIRDLVHARKTPYIEKEFNRYRSALVNALEDEDRTKG